jgi:hypothetical protein
VKKINNYGKGWEQAKESKKEMQCITSGTEFKGRK